ncbi:hypothetical protein SDC9_167232 [bioreactor metagenome]|uniref:Uncharacterized protein n=1 Tax=bioreactor metagenome TaxID=1076179 RepID=A0A645G221_9ZZZZ
MLPAVFLPIGPGQQPGLGVVVHHGGGQSVVPVKAQNLPVHIAEHLIHIQGKVGKLVPIHRALLPQTRL